MIKTCTICNKQFTKPSNVTIKIFEKRKYCSPKCVSIGLSGHEVSKETRGKISEAIKNKNIERTKRKVSSETKFKIMMSLLGRHTSPKTEFTSEKIAGNKHPRWKGGIRMSTGYKLIHFPSHPNNKNGYVKEHHLAIEKIIGRTLKPGEVVHHINGNKLDNRVENLMYFSSESEHQKFHNSY